MVYILGEVLRSSSSTSIPGHYQATAKATLAGSRHLLLTSTLGTKRSTMAYCAFFGVVVCCGMLVLGSDAATIDMSTATLGSTCSPFIIRGSGFGVNTTRVEVEFTHRSIFQHRNFSAAVLSNTELILRLMPTSTAYYPFQAVTHKWHGLNGTTSVPIVLEQLRLDGVAQLSATVQVAVVVPDSVVRTTHTVIHPHSQQLRIHGSGLDCTDLAFQFEPQLVRDTHYTLAFQNASLVVLDRISGQNWLLGEYGSSPVTARRVQCHQANDAVNTEVRCGLGE